MTDHSAVSATLEASAPKVHDSKSDGKWTQKRTIYFTDVAVGGENLDRLYLSTGPLTAAEIRSLSLVTITCASHDQGWATGEGSWTWGEMSTRHGAQEKTKFKRTIVFRNARANIDWQVHNFALQPAIDNCLGNLVEGDEIGLWVRSTLPGWNISVKNASITLHFSYF